VQNLVCNARLH